ncbi:C-type lectin domain-containing protein [Cyanobacterium aponinum UTEX 3222]|uniref:C-type lectin domain-containing protein n=1 Tax=Cyanobacterium aponinum TaxID=379064 RepID=UPI00308FC083|nr:C-type lectin domain-containing protein [Cyanobacterium aponinum UTEX 3222]
MIFNQKLNHYQKLFLLTLTNILMVNYSLNAQEKEIFVNPNNGNKYFLTSEMSWQDAQNLAEKMGGNLVTVNDEKENQWLIETFITSETNFLWIGINDQAVEGEFIWISGEMSNYLNWAEGEPNNNPQQGGEHFGVINGSNNPFKRPVGTWSDAPEQAKLKGIIELKNNQN